MARLKLRVNHRKPKPKADRVAKYERQERVPPPKKKRK
jgi:hypothetical protein